MTAQLARPVTLDDLSKIVAERIPATSADTAELKLRIEVDPSLMREIDAMKHDTFWWESSLHNWFGHMVYSLSTKAYPGQTTGLSYVDVEITFKHGLLI